LRRRSRSCSGRPTGRWRGLARVRPSWDRCRTSG
jgi:hypothetical protein